MKRPRILIADDEQHILSLLSLTLRRKGYEVLTATDGGRAWDLLQAFQVSLLIVDETMPVLTGSQLIEKVGAKVPVMIVTARPKLAEHEDVPAGVVAVLPKPFSPSDLVARVEALIGPGTQPTEQVA